MQQKYMPIIYEEVKKAVGRALQRYTTISKEERQTLETKGVNLANFINDELTPVITNIKTTSILVIMEEGLGNMIMLLPLLQILKATFPAIKLTVWCSTAAKKLIENKWYVDSVITDFDYNYYDLVYYTIWSNSTRAVYENTLKAYCRANISVERKEHHEILQHIGLALFFDCPCDTLPYPEINITECSIPFKTPYIVFGDTTLKNNHWDKKHWPYYVELAELIQKKYPEYKIALIGDNDDLKLYQEKTWPENVTLDLVGKLSITETAWLIKNATFYVGNDTGPTHISAALGTKTFALFGPTLVAKNKPLGSDVTVLQKRIPCSPCQYTDRWESCTETMCYQTAQEVYSNIFFTEANKEKFKTLLVGDFSGGALRNEVYIKRTLEKSFGHKVIQLDYRADLNKTKNSGDTSYNIISEVLHHNVDLVLICGGQQLSPLILNNIQALNPKTKVFCWYADCRGQVEEWFYHLSAVCDSSFWHVGDPLLLSGVFSKNKKPCMIGLITPDNNSYFPIESIKKDIDVLFVGTPHSPHRLQLLEHLINKGVNVQIYGNGNWPKEFATYTHPGVFDKDYNQLLNRAKLVINTNFINEVPLYFSDRYFYPMATKGVGVNQYIPMLENMFEDGKHMVFFKDPEDCYKQIEALLKDEAKQNYIREEGYNLYLSKYTLKQSLTTILNEL